MVALAIAVSENWTFWSTTPGPHTRTCQCSMSMRRRSIRVYAVNVKSIYLGANHAVPVFRKQGSGNIINVASTAGVRPRPGLTWYNGSKGAAIILTKSMAVELAAGCASVSMPSTR